MHLGKLPTGLPDSVAGDLLAHQDLGPVGAWRRTVEYAVGHQVDAVVLAGDVVHAANARFEAFGPLKAGVEQLIDQGIQVCAVAGNHDVATLPRLADQIDGFHLLGAGGTWSEQVVTRQGEPLVRLVGWSFPRPSVRTSPLEDGFPDLAGDLPTLGVLHGDLDAAGSTYAPVSSTALRGLPVSAWFLGHIHRPTLLPDARPLLGYLGSLVGLDPTETGRHGPWLVTVDERGDISAEHLPLARLRWERVEVDLTGLADPDGELDGLLTSALEARRRELADELGETRVLGCRLVLRGASPHYRGISDYLERVSLTDLVIPDRQTNVTLFVQRVLNETTPALDLADLARNDDPPGLLARDLLALRR